MPESQPVNLTRIQALHSQEILRVDARLLENGPQRSFRQVARMIRDRCVSVFRCAEPDLMAAGGLAVELEAAGF